MNNLFKAAFLPALTYLVDKSGFDLKAKTGAYTGVDLSTRRVFAGLQGQVAPSAAAFRVAPSFESAPGSDAGRWQLNADVLTRPRSDGSLAPYGGGGLCVVGTSKDDASLRFGINLVGGANISLGSLDAFAQLRVTLADGINVSLTGGALPKDTK